MVDYTCSVGVMKGKRMIIALVLAALFGIYCAYGTTEYMKTARVPGFEVTIEYLLPIFYNRVLMGFAVGLAGGVVLTRRKFANAAIRGAILGAIFSLGISLYGFLTGAYVFMIFGAIYGAVTDLAATRFGS